jgi:hypothetical protein
MVLSKLDLSLVAVLAAALFCIEHGHRVMIGSLAAAAVATNAVSACPDTDDVPFSAECLQIINGGTLPAVDARVSTAAITPVAASGADRRVELHAPACPPSNENAPYSARCLRFLAGGFWHP